MADVTTQTVVLPGLGVPFLLGHLYNCKEERLVPSFTLWDQASLNDNVSKTDINETTFEIIMEDSFSEKASALDLKGSMQLSFLVGQVDVSGSASYLSDKNIRSCKQRVTVQFKAKTRFEQLGMEHMSKLKYRNELVENTDATHVVTAILYGSQAFFVFDIDTSTDDKEANIKGKMKAAVLKVLGKGRTGNAIINSDEIDKEFTERISCRFYGDFHLNETPTTYEDAMRLTKELPQKLKDRNHKPVPLQVWLHPLNALNLRTDKILHNICDSTAKIFCDIFEYLDDFAIACNDLLAQPGCDSFPEVRENILEVQNFVRLYRLEFQTHILNLLPKVKGACIPETVLSDVVTSKENSPFGKRYLQNWSKEQQKLVSALNTFTANLQNVHFSTSNSTLQSLLIDMNYKYVMCLTLRFGTRDTTKLHMQKYLKNKSASEHLTIEPFPDDFYISLKNKAMEFKSFFDANISNVHTKCTVSSDTKQTANRGVFICLYENTKPDTNYSPPTPPNSVVQLAKSHDSITVSWSEEHVECSQKSKAIAFMFLFSFLLFYLCNISLGYSLLFLILLFGMLFCFQLSREMPDILRRKRTTYINHGYRVKYVTEDVKRTETQTNVIQTTQNTLSLNKLRIGTLYEISVQSYTSVGSSAWSTPIRIRTFPVSCPSKPIASYDHQNTGKIILRWKKPKHFADNFQLTGYQVKYKVIASDKWNEIKLNVGIEPRATFKLNLREDSECVFTVLACGNLGKSDLSEPSMAIQVKRSKLSLKEQSDIEDSVSNRLKISTVNLMNMSVMLTEGPPCIYTLPSKVTYTNRHLKIRKWEYGTRLVPHKQDKLIMVIGESGAGKTTLIDGMINYIFGVEWNDKFRFKIPAEPSESIGESHHGTKWFNVLTIHSQDFLSKPFSITIVDTPDFQNIPNGTIPKILKDLRIHSENWPCHLTALCLVIGATNSHLNTDQRCMMKSFPSNLGVNIGSENVYLMLTFADHRTPPVLGAMRECGMTVSRYLRFNNAGLFADNSARNLESMLWDMNQKNYEQFFQTLGEMDNMHISMLDTLTLGE